MTDQTPAASPTAMSPDICCLNWRGLFAYLRKHHGEEAVSRLVEGVVGNPAYLLPDRTDTSRLAPVTLENLEDESCWISNELSLRLLGNVNQVVPLPDPLRVAGEGAVLERLSRGELFVSRILGPKALSRQVQRINARFNRTKEVELTRLANREAVFSLRYFPGFRVTKDVCRWNLGIYIGMLRASGCRLIDARETKCVLDGDDCCEFSLSWGPAGLYKRLFRWLLRSTVNDLLAEYDHTLRDRNRLIMALTQEIESRRKAQESLASSERRHRELFEGVNDLILTHDSQGVITSINPAVVRALGYPVAEVKGRPLSHFMPPSSRELYRDEYLPRILATGEDSGIVRCLDRSGQPRLFEYRNVVSLDQNGQPQVNSIARDVTERIEAHRRMKQMQAEIIQARKMEAVGNLASGIAHDFNNLLQAIMGFTQLLLADEGLEPAVREALEQIDLATQRGADLVRRLVSFGIPSPETLRPTDLNQEIRQAIDLLERTLPKMITIEYDFGVGLCPVMAAPSSLEQVFLNLALNAKDAMPQGGRIKVSTRAESLDREQAESLGGLPPGEYLRLTISDSGEGVPPEVLGKIFDPFFTTKPLGHGSGLGLYTVYQIVKAMGGHIACVSPPGQGTTFEIVLPCCQEDLPASVDQAPFNLLALTGNHTVILADDEASILTAGRTVLSQAGYRVRAVTSGEEALELYRSLAGEVALVILDLGMPGMGGQRCLEAILDQDPRQPVIVASGYSVSPALGELLKRPNLRFIQKPYRFSELLHLMRTILRQRAPLADEAEPGLAP
ncbi:MAG: response regulator [Desulfarculus sp.]|nr:response regulator [Desulfarculus sp.]